MSASEVVAEQNLADYVIAEDTWLAAFLRFLGAAAVGALGVVVVLALI